MHNKNQAAFVTAAICGGIVVIWIGLLIAPYMKDGFIALAKGLEEITSQGRFFSIKLCGDTFKVTGFLTVMYTLIILLWRSNRGKQRPGEEHGSSMLGNPKKTAKKFRDKLDPSNDKIFTRSFRMSIDPKMHNLNLLSVIIGGPGTWKSWSYAKPNLLQGNSSYVTLDPKGELLRDTGDFLKRQGYRIVVLDLKGMWRSSGYNPFAYLHDDNDIQRLATNLMKSTTPKNSGGNMDHFWEDKAEELLMALLFFLYYSFPKEEMHFPHVMDLLHLAAIEDESKPRSELDNIIDSLAKTNPDHPAIKYFASYRAGAVKTKQSIQSTLSAHLTKFNLSSVRNLTMRDELHLERMGEEKTALFCVIPHNDKSFNFLVSILYMQLFQILMNSADQKHDGVLPVPVHFLMDEFANVSIPDDFRSILSTMRSYRIFVSIIVQNLTDLKSIFKDEWESIVGDCDELLYLGGNESDVHKYISERIGDETIETKSYGESRGAHGSSSRNRQSAGRKLIQPSEIAKMPKRKCILLVNGEDPIVDLKYNISDHPNYIYESHGKQGKKYQHGTLDSAIGTIRFASVEKYIDNIPCIAIDEEKIEQEVTILNPDDLNGFFKL